MEFTLCLLSLYKNYHYWLAGQELKYICSEIVQKYFDSPLQ